MTWQITDFRKERGEEIRDRQVVGLTNRTVSRDLQMKEDLTLATAITTARQAEEVTEHVKTQLLAEQSVLISNVQEVRWDACKQQGHYASSQVCKKPGGSTAKGRGICEVNMPELEELCLEDSHDPYFVGSLSAYIT